MNSSCPTAFVALVFALAAPAASAPTPIPGGANQVTAMSGIVGKPVWNGVLKVTVAPLRDASEEESKAFLPLATQRVMYFSARRQFGTHDEFTDGMSYMLADANGITAEIPLRNLTHANPHILQGGAQVQAGTFAVDRDFVPVKLVVQCDTCGSRTAFRAIGYSLPRG